MYTPPNNATTQNDDATTNKYDAIQDEASSLTTLLWHFGEPLITKQQREQPHTQCKKTWSLEKHNSNLTIDAVTISQLTATERIRVQSETWGQSIRFFFGATENDDTDPDCNSDFIDHNKNTNDDNTLFSKVKIICRHNKGFGTGMNGMRKWFLRPSGMQKQTNPVGWLCAQQRFAATMGKVGEFYQRELRNAVQTTTATAAFSSTSSCGVSDILPDFLLIQDDDTYFNMKVLHRDVFSKMNASTTFVGTGCLIKIPATRLSFPFGGYGTFLSQGSLLRMIQPICCTGTSSIATSEHEFKHLWDIEKLESFTQHACMQLETNTMGEQSFFQDGMSVSDLMRAHAAANPYRDSELWEIDGRPGYCFHGDWVLGYFFNYYLFDSPQPQNSSGSSIPYMNMDASLGKLLGSVATRGNCVHTGTFCPPTAHSCHRVNASTMAQLFSERS